MHRKKISSILILLTAVLFAGNVTAISSTTSYDFDTCGSSGRYGPSQSSCDSSYSHNVNVVGNGIQEWTVPSNGEYTITAAGAEGGGNGGNGARVRGTATLNSGQVLSIGVGQKGGNGGSRHGAGGGTFIVATNDYSFASLNDILVIAGGGGGENYDQNSRYNAVPRTSGQHVGGQAGGDNGYGGNSQGSTYDSSGGGGFRGNGQDGGSSGGTGGNSFQNGLVGGQERSGFSSWGGFGGGGGADTGGAGAGGFSGGAAADNDGRGYGGYGGSFLADEITNGGTHSGDYNHQTGSVSGYSGGVSDIGGTNTGHGYVSIQATSYYYPIIESYNLVNEDTSSSQYTLEVIVNHELGSANDDDISSCDVTVDDNDGNSNTYSMNMDRGYGNGDQARCYQTISASDVGGWQKGESLDYQVTATDSEGDSTTGNTNSHRLPNFFLNLEDSSGSKVSGVTTTAYDLDTSNVVSTGSLGADDCNHQTGSNGWVACGLPPNSEYDIEAGFVNMYDIDTEPLGEEVRLRYNQYDSSESGDYYQLDMTTINQIAEEITDADFTIRKTGTNDIVFETTYNKNDGEISVPFDQKDMYDITISTSEYQSNLEYTNVRVPDVLETGENQNFIPESTLSNSIQFSAGHVLPAQTFVTRPFGDFDVVNVSIEKNLNNSYRLVSDILVRKYNVNFEGSWQDWSNRKTVTVQEIYNRDWSDSTGEMNDAWGIIEFNPEGFQNNDCSDVRLTDTNNNVQDFTVNTCQDNYVQLEFNAPIDALEAKDFYVYYGNSGASDAQTPVERLSEKEDFQMDNGITNTEGSFWFQSAGQKNFNMSIPQNVEFLNRDINIEGNNKQPQDNQLSSTIDDAYQEYSGIEFTPKRPTVIEGMDLEIASTTVDSEIAIRNKSSGNIIHTRSIPDNGPGSYYINFTDETVSEGNGDNIIYRPGDTFRVIVRNGQARRDTSTVTSSPMFEFPDFTVDNQVYACSSDGSSCSTGDYPTLVSSIETISLLPNLTITYDNQNTVVYDDAQHLNTGTIDLSSILQSEEWREGDPLDDPRVHEFTVDSGDEGNITLESYTSFEFEHPVESVTKSAAACSVNPQSPTYFYIDKTDCPYLDRINVTQGQWFRLDYRFRVPGPTDFENTGDINSYNVSDTMVRYNTLAETEEFTSG